MQLDKLNQWLMFGANIGVILGIIFLALEVQQNNELMAAQNRFNRLSVQTGTTTNIAVNPQLADILNLLESGERELTGSEMLQVSAFQNRVFRNMEWSFLELEEEELLLEEWQIVAQNKSFQIFWPQFRSRLDAGFVDYLERNTAIDGD